MVSCVNGLPLLSFLSSSQGSGQPIFLSSVWMASVITSRCWERSCLMKRSFESILPSPLRRLSQAIIEYPRAAPWLRSTVESERSLCCREMGSFARKWSMRLLATPRFPSQFSKSMGLTLCGMVLDPTSPSFAFCCRYPFETYSQVSLQSPMRMVLEAPTSVRARQRLSCGSICVVQGLNLRPSLPSTKDCEMRIQSRPGKVKQWALQLPTAPLNLPVICTRLRWWICVARRQEKFANSFPRVVGDAGWPCVCASIACEAQASLLVTSASRRAVREGRRAAWRESRSMRAQDKLLMSSLVQQKWMCSLQCATLLLRQYSTDLRSWFVTASISFTFPASAASNPLSTASSCAVVSSSDALPSAFMIPCCSMCSSHCDSTRMRYFMSAASEKKGDSAPVLLWYLPSSGESAVRELNPRLKIDEDLIIYNVWTEPGFVRSYMGLL